MAYADVNGLSLYYEEHGTGEPLLLLHGGIAGSEAFAPLVPDLSATRRVILVDLQGHGRTADVDRPLRPTMIADDIAAFVGWLGLDRIDMLGYSLGGEVALRTAIQHPGVVGRLVLVSVACRRDGWFPEVLEMMDAMQPEAAEMMKASPAYAFYAEHAPRPEDWGTLVAKTAELLKVGYDWTAEIESVTAPAMLVYADADSILPAHVAEFYGLFGGGLGDPGWDGSGRPEAQLAVLPGATHYDLLESPLLAPAVLGFLDR
jgi:pimeloyl-ACP methyl ester carboxylesterase